VTLGDKERDDVIAALDFAARLPGVEGRLGVFAFSMGGWAATPVAARDARVRGLVLAGVTSSFERQGAADSGIRSVFYLEGLRREFRHVGVDLEASRAERFIADFSPRPLLVVRGSLDTVVPAAWTDALFAAAREPKELWTVDGAAHGHYFEAQGERYTGRLVAFFDFALGVHR
jgi:fermentation-respiration switch protein FrsA (DUF1100 family)